ncbi:hypothetical protein BGY98DRAFT_184790 [Russula aff. rugulosa BPL654]|nr:hypothetical protein BGY98DRAFT_184790 [Russula aff. rugulosa BPL654]
MDTPQPPPIVNQMLKRKERSPSPARRTTGHTSTASSRPSPTSLPSIRHFLPPQPDTAQLNERYHPNNRQQTGSAFSGPSAGIPRLDFLPPPPARPPAERTHSGIIGDSDGDGDSEQAARPKQKRRRQALSCTECKRRKIKCDRAHPCTPCIRRGDQNKCQWHVIEPVDKYVSRAEYDELKARVDHLETLLLSRAQLQSGFAPQPQQGPESTSSSQAQPKPLGTRLPAAATPGQQQACGAISTAPAPMPLPIMPYDLPPPNSSPVGRTSSTTATTTTTITTLPSIASLANGSPPHPTGVARLHLSTAATAVAATATATATTATIVPGQAATDKKLPRADVHPAGRAPALPPPYLSPRPSGRLSPLSSPQQQQQQQQHPPQTPPNINVRSPTGPPYSSAHLPRSPPPRTTAQRDAVRASEREGQ